MLSKASLWLAACLVVLTLACRRPHEPVPSQTAGGAPAVPAQPASPPAAAVPAEPPPAAGAPSAEGVLASQETNWSGVVAEVTGLRRKGNTLTALVRLRNRGSGEPEPDIRYNEVYLMDLAGGKKYEVLRDENGTFIAAVRSGWTDRWYERLSSGQAATLWMKFPAPPADVKTITLQLPGALPFEDLPIQDS